MKIIKLTYFALIAVSIFLSSCKTNKFNSDQTGKLIEAIWLNYDTTSIFLNDYIADCNKIDSVWINKCLIRFDTNKIIKFKADTTLKYINEMKIWEKKKPVTVLLKKSPKTIYNYSFDSKGKVYKSVQLSGEFNGWTASKTNLINVGGVWKTQLLLNPGDYQYQIILDGKAQLDPDNTNSVSNNMGGFNSLLTVGNIKHNLKPQLLTNTYTASTVQVSVKNTVDDYFVLWQNYRLDASEYSWNNGILTINIPSDAKRLHRSYIRVYSYNSEGVSNDILVPLANGKVIKTADELSRNDVYNNILYNVFVDRFFNGSTANDRPVKDSLILPRANYLGGDITGIKKIIQDKYFSNLGVNTLWISPVVRNPEGAFGEWKKPYSKFSGYHGYWPISFTKIDDRFGTDAEFKNLVSTAHSKDMNVLLDFVAHHVHKEHPIYKAHPEWTTSLYLPDGTLNTEKWDEHRLTTWFDVFLPTLDLSKKEVSDMLSDSALWWIREYKLDGFRHDATKHVPLVFWQKLTNKLKREVEIKENRPIYQVGETYGSVELIASYLGSGMLDGQFDFNVYDAALGAFARGDDFKMLKYRLTESLDNYGYHNKMCYITGNQDRGRFISYAGGSLKFDENAKEAGWTRNIEVGDTSAYKKLEMLMAFIMTIPGLPVIYYGDEFGMPGGNDPDSRRMMRFGNNLNNLEQRTLGTTQKLTKIRKTNLAIIYGDFIWLENSESFIAYARKYFDNIVIVLFNNSPVAKTYKIENTELLKNKKFTSSFNSKIRNEEKYIEVKVPAKDFEILINQ